jgi:hypothetical protein
MHKLAALFIASIAVLGTAAACGNDDDESTNPAEGSEVADGQVDVVLQEYTIETTAPASTSPLTFQIVNQGYLPHRLVVLDTELEYFSLPKNERGGLDLTSEEIEIVADSGEIPSGESGTLEADLPAGSYVLADPGSSFLSGGMRVPFTIE